MAKFGGSKMYPRGPMIAHSASNCVADLPIGIDKDFFRSLVSMRTRGLRFQGGHVYMRRELGVGQVEVVGGDWNYYGQRRRAERQAQRLRGVRQGARLVREGPQELRLF